MWDWEGELVCWGGMMECVGGEVVEGSKYTAMWLLLNVEISPVDFREYLHRVYYKRKPENEIFQRYGSRCYYGTIP